MRGRQSSRTWRRTRACASSPSPFLLLGPIALAPSRQRDRERGGCPRLEGRVQHARLRLLVYVMSASRSTRRTIRATASIQNVGRHSDARGLRPRGRQHRCGRGALWLSPYVHISYTGELDWMVETPFSSREAAGRLLLSISLFTDANALSRPVYARRTAVRRTSAKAQKKARPPPSTPHLDSLFSCVAERLPRSDRGLHDSAASTPASSPLLGWHPSPRVEFPRPATAPRHSGPSPSRERGEGLSPPSPSEAFVPPPSPLLPLSRRPLSPHGSPPPTPPSPQAVASPAPAPSGAAAVLLAAAITLAASPEAAQASELSDSLRKEIDAIEETLDFLDQARAARPDEVAGWAVMKKWLGWAAGCCCCC